jgi:hypothetical protein
MSLTLSQRSLRFVGWVLPILAALFCAPSVARAGCGDYVVTRGTQLDQAMPSEHQPANVPSPLPAGPNRPCHGPNCSGGPVVPPLSVPVVVAPAPTEWGCLAGLLAFVPSGQGAFLPDLASLAPVSFATSVFHPPRCAA